MIISPEWKNRLSREAITFIGNGGNVKQFIGELKEMDFVNSDNIGQILGFWNKRMLSQIFKWDDKSKSMILDEIDEFTLLTERASFIAKELAISDVVVVTAENYAGEDGRENAALPLSPSIVFA